MQFTHWQSASTRFRRGHLVLLAVSVGLPLLGLTSACNRPPPAAPVQAPAPETPEVKVVRPQKKDVRRPIERPGFNIEAYERTPLYATIPAYDLKWNFDHGAR